MTGVSNKSINISAMSLSANKHVANSLIHSSPKPESFNSGNRVVEDGDGGQPVLS